MTSYISIIKKTHWCIHFKCVAYLIWLPLDKISKRETEAALPETTVDVESLALKPVVLIIQKDVFGGNFKYQSIN